MADGWNAYIKLLEGSTDAIKRAAIVGFFDGVVWAKSSRFNASTDELKKFTGLFEDVDSAPERGADLEKVHYIVPRAEEDLIFGKKDKTGFFAARSKTAVVIAVYEGENETSAKVRTTVEEITKYMKDSGY